MKNIESNYVKDVTIPIYLFMAVQKLGQSTLENTQDKFQPGMRSGDGSYVGSDPSHELMHWSII